MHGLHLLAAHFINQIFLIGTVYVFVKCLNGCRLKPVPFLVCTMLGLWKIKAYTWVNTNTCWSQCRFNIGIAGFCVFFLHDWRIAHYTAAICLLKASDRDEISMPNLSKCNCTGGFRYTPTYILWLLLPHQVAVRLNKSTPNQPSIEALI